MINVKILKDLVTDSDGYLVSAYVEVTLENGTVYQTTMYRATENQSSRSVPETASTHSQTDKA